MKRGKLLITVAWVSVAPLAAPVMSQTPGAGAEAPPATTSVAVSGATFFAGVRLWANRFDVPALQSDVVVQAPGVLVRQTSVTNNTSDTEFVPMPVIGFRIDRFVASASYFPRTSYDGGEVLGTVKRDEFDVSIGYSVLPSLVVSIGYKRGTQDKLIGQADPVTGEIPPSGVTSEGILLGASASLPIAGRLFLYGNAAYGIGRNKYDFADAEGKSRRDADYRIGEIGVSYVAYEGAPDSPVKSLLVSFGYRAQVLTTKDVALGTFAFPSNQPLSIQKKDVRTTTDGFVLGVVGVF
jgi:hypothetical protein